MRPVESRVCWGHKVQGQGGKFVLSLGPFHRGLVFTVTTGWLVFRLWLPSWGLLLTFAGSSHRGVGSLARDLLLSSWRKVGDLSLGLRLTPLREMRNLSLRLKLSSGGKVQDLSLGLWLTAEGLGILLSLGLSSERW